MPLFLSTLRIRVEPTIRLTTDMSLRHHLVQFRCRGAWFRTQKIQRVSNIATEPDLVQQFQRPIGIPNVSEPRRCPLSVRLRSAA